MNKRLLLSLIMHMLIAGGLVTLLTLGPYMYKVHLYGNYLSETDGTGVSNWEYLLLMKKEIAFFMFLAAPLVELNYWFVFKNRWKLSPLLSSIIIGLVLTTLTFSGITKDGFFNSASKIIPYFLIFTAYAFTYGFIRNASDERNHRKELELQQTNNELKALKAQLNPHFFFNSLNYLYGTALAENAHRTAKAAATLSDMMRYTISGMKENFVPVSEEIDFINNYLFLQRERLPQIENIRIAINIQSDTGNQKIAPLLMLPFIENAFKYGISIDYPCYISLEISVVGDDLVMKIFNQIIHQHTVVKGNNTGIANTRRRLELLYKNNFSLDIRESDGGYTVMLSLKLLTS
jgi:sensor histidine kinase YesM